MRILAIETSCDETSIAVLESKNDGSFNLLSNIVSSQIKIHAPYGGVVPMLAKREHQRNLLPILKKSLQESKLLKISNFPASPAGGQFLISKQTSNSKTLNLKLKNLKTILDREPELLKKLLPFLKKYQKPNIDLIAVTNGPGLEPALWVGVNFAKALGYFWNLPVMPINHVEGHIIANWLPQPENKIPPTLPLKREELDSSPSFLKEGWGGFPSSVHFPAICLVVSGGHTQLVLMKKLGQYKILGETRDDAAGEAFDKLAKMLNLGYPGGPIISQIAAKLESKIRNSKSPPAPPKGGGLPPFREGWGGFSPIVKLPRPMLNTKDYDFSFSGLKTAALYFVKTLSPAQLKKLTPAICVEFQQAAIDVLVSKTIRAAKEFGARTILLSGGVAANDLLRETLKRTTYSLSEVEGSKINFSVPPKEFCTDNAAMIALTAAMKAVSLFIKGGLRGISKNEIPPRLLASLKLWRSGPFTKGGAKYNWQKIRVDSNLRLA
ncbi:MAG: tRNA (adenosine(37)-N6)-threonylcarbamoyltransferase complex transferase subunit TsaD [Candidatus Portnoybacteria bacterium]|nr:tRNA (adenosine(37)-N6)-threonylcarbamoyltransferase complex transferase subunit TsaD [Candidatus Portnoybacteria bacterium]